MQSLSGHPVRSEVLSGPDTSRLAAIRCHVTRQDEKPEGGFQVLSKCPGKELAGLRYEPLFPFFAHLAAQPGAAKGAFRVVADTYVTDDSGTGVVHQVRVY